MKILLAPSETKKEGGVEPFSLDSLIFKELKETRAEVLKEYTNILQNADFKMLSKLLGSNKQESGFTSLRFSKEPR